MQSVGKFVIESGKVLITDPIYDSEDGDFGILTIDVKSGEWQGYVSKTNDKYTKIMEFITYHVDVDKRDLETVKLGSVSVDSGQCGIFDAKYFKDDNNVGDKKLAKADQFFANEKGEKWLRMCEYATGDYANYKTKELKLPCDVINNGIVCASGYGDGVYPVFGGYDNNEITYLMISFESVSDDEE